MEKRHGSLKTFFNQIIKKRVPVLLSMIVVFSILPTDVASGLGLVNQAEAAISLSEPLISDGKVTWDCVYFGTYPQTEVKTNDNIYAELASSSTGWNSNGDTTASDGERYHMIKSSDATYTSSGSTFFQWDSNYHYFRYEPIKWRGLNVTSSEALLLSDKLLDDQRYDLSDYSGVSWETCNLRSWISNTFIGKAFTNDEKSAINSKSLVNNVYPASLIGSSAGNSTVDKVFLLSSEDVATSQTAVDYGFSNSVNTDEKRVAKSTDYARAMGVENRGSNSGYWWLRTIGSRYTYNGMNCRALAVGPGGEMNIDGYDFTSYAAGLRPALYLNLSQDFNSYYSYAGTVASDGTVGDGQKEDDPDVPIVTPSTYIVNYDANGGSGAPAAQTKTSGIALTLRTEEPIRSGYTFVGWATSKSAVSANYKAGGTYTSNGDVTLYAVWVSDGTGTGDNPGTETGNDDKDDPVVVIPPKNQIITASGKTVAIKTPAFYLGARTNGDGKLTYKSSKTSVATVSSSGKITVRNYGITTITITAAATSAYKKAVSTVRITVVPKKMKIKSIKSPKKGQLKVTWVKDKAASGYQVQLCLNNKFNGHTFQKNFSKKYNTTKRPVAGLTSKKKYYVRVRTYKKLSGTTLYGIWSYARMIKIK